MENGTENGRPKAALTVDEVARLLGISRGLAFRGCHDGSIPSIRIGRRLLVPRARFLALLGEHNPSEEGDIAE